MMFVAALLIALSTAQLAQATPEPEPTLSPNQIFRRAVRHLQSLPQPEYIDQITQWHELSSRGPRIFKERILWDSRNRRECVIGGTVRTPVRPEDINESYFAPDSWLLTIGENRRPKSYIADPDVSDLRVIGSVATSAIPFYNVRMVGIEHTTKAGTAYHLRLDPLSDPLKHNIRELWINTETDNIMSAVLFARYALNRKFPVQPSLVQEDFGQVGPFWLMIHRAWHYSPGPGQIDFQEDADTAEMRFGSAIPEWFFHDCGFDSHAGESEIQQGSPSPAPSPVASGS